jgi:hypothetical protein
MHEGIRWLLGWFVILGIVWFALGGPQRDSGGFFTNTGTGTSLSGSTQNLDQNNDGVVDLNETIAGEITKIQTELDEVEKALKKIEKEANDSVYRDMLTLDQGTATTDDPEREYLRLRVTSSFKGEVVLTGWYLESSMTGRKVSLPLVTKLPISGQAGSEQTLRVRAGDTLVINTARSPIGHSFQINSCIGYFEQFQNFNPQLPRTCPDPADEPAVDYGPQGFGDACLDYIEGLPLCTAHIGSPPLGMPYQCQHYISTKINYNACVEFHKNDSDFYKNEWRIYLGQEDELWKAKRELITLRDSAGKIVSIVTY